MSRRRIVVTGLGMVTPLGLNVKETWQNILAGKSGVERLPESEPEFANISTQIAARIKGFNVEEYLNPKDARKMDTFIQYGFAAAAQALHDSGLQMNEETALRTGAALGSGIGGIAMIEKNHHELINNGPRRISPFFIPGAIINMLPGQVSIHFGLKGPTVSVVTACTTGAHNIGLAARMITSGDADIMLAGGAEMASTPLGLAGFAACRALSTRNDAPEQASRPWDKERDGFVLGDGAGVLVLEELEHAKRRGARIYAELIGFGMSSDAFHMTSPEETGAGAMQAMMHALQDAQLEIGAVDYINAHGTSTSAGDRLEALAIKRTFNDQAYRMAISSTKSMTGHLLGAAGAIEAIFSVLAIRDQVAPPTINLDQPDEGCDLDFVPHTARKMKIQVAMSNSFGFGGTNGTLIFSKFE